MPESKRNQPTTYTRMKLYERQREKKTPAAQERIRILRLIPFSHLRFTHKYNARSLPYNINATSYSSARAHVCDDAQCVVSGADHLTINTCIVVTKCRGKRRTKMKHWQQQWETLNEVFFFRVTQGLIIGTHFLDSKFDFNSSFPRYESNLESAWTQLSSWFHTWTRSNYKCVGFVGELMGPKYKIPFFFNLQPLGWIGIRMEACVWAVICERIFI